MKKNSTKGYVLLGILFALVSIIAFAVPTAKQQHFGLPMYSPLLHLQHRSAFGKLHLVKRER